MNKCLIAPVKLNLNLHVIGVNHDGYHLLEGVSVFTNDGDILEITLSDSDNDDLIISGRFASFLQAENIQGNLIVKAVKSLRAYKNFPYLKIYLDKNIPIQAGYGGGSSDAATILKGINDLFNLNVSFDDLIKIGQSLGADVPMCLYAQPCFIQNIGDDIQILPLQDKTYFCLLLKPNFMLSTVAVFKVLIHKYNPRMPKTDNLMHYALTQGRNDLWQAALNIKPELYRYLEALNTTNPIKASMSGSGSGLFALYDNENTLESAFQEITEQFPNDFIMKTFIKC